MRSHTVFKFLVFAVVAFSWPALAQFGPPRPPADVDYPPAQRNLPSNQFPPPYPTEQRGGVQSQPLPPPGGQIPGGTIINPQQSQQRPTQQQPGGNANAPYDPNLPPVPQALRQKAKMDAKQPLQPGTPDQPEAAEVPVQQAPIPKISNPTAVFSGLDKITGRIITFEAAIDETVQFGSLQVTPRACYTRPATEIQNTTSFIEVDEITLQGDIKRIFTGWMFANSPGLHGVEHAIYDVWITDCKTTPPAMTASGGKK